MSWRYAQVPATMGALAALLACQDTETGEDWCWGVAVERTIQPGDQRFFLIGGLQFRDDGTIYVLDPLEPSLAAFDTAGSVRWRVGRDGGGPEEFRNPNALQWLGGRLVVRDHENYRHSFWSSDGHHVELLQLSSLGLPSPPGMSWALPDGAVLATLMPLTRRAQPGAQRPGAHVRVGRDPRTVDTLGTFVFPSFLMIKRNGMAQPVERPYAEYPRSTVAPDGTIAIATGSGYVVEVFEPDGRHRLTIRGPAEQPRLLPEHRQVYERRLSDPRIAEQLEYPDPLPAIDGLSSTADGMFLIRTNWVAGDRVRWDLWTSSGNYEHSLLLPAAMSQVTGHGRRVVARMVDSLDVDFVTVLRPTDTTACPGPPVVQ